MKNALFLMISLAILLMPIDSSASIGGLRTVEGNEYLYTDCDPNWSVTAYHFYTTNHYYKLHGHGVCTQVYVNQPSYDKPGFHKPGKRWPDKPMTYGINLEINYNPIDQTFIEKATVSTAYPGDESVTWIFTTTGRWPVDPVIYFSPSEGPLWNLATSNSPACDIYTNCIPMTFPLFVNSLPGAQLEQLANEARSAPPPPCNPNALGPPTIVSPPKDVNPFFRSKNVPFYFEIPSCKFTDYKNNVFLIEAQKRKPSPNSEDPTFLPWEPFPLPDWSMIKMKPAIYDKDIRSFGAETIRIRTEEEYAEIRFRVKSIIWFQNKFHDTDFTDWQYIRVGKPHMTKEGRQKAIATVPIQVGPPDFRIRSVKAFPKVENNKPVLVFAWTIENIGTGKGDVTGFGLKRCLINGQNSCPPDFEDRKNWRVHGWQFWPGEGIDLYPNKTADVWVTVPRPLEPTQYGFIAKADFSDLVDESDETNNEHSFYYFSPAIEKLSINDTAAIRGSFKALSKDPKITLSNLPIWDLDYNGFWVRVGDQNWYWKRSLGGHQNNLIPIPAGKEIHTHFVIMARYDGKRPPEQPIDMNDDIGFLINKDLVVRYGIKKYDTGESQCGGGAKTGAGSYLFGDTPLQNVVNDINNGKGWIHQENIACNFSTSAEDVGTYFYPSFSIDPDNQFPETDESNNKVMNWPIFKVVPNEPPATTSKSPPIIISPQNTQRILSCDKDRDYCKFSVAMCLNFLPEDPKLWKFIFNLERFDDLSNQWVVAGSNIIEGNIRENKGDFYGEKEIAVSLYGKYRIVDVKGVYGIGGWETHHRPPVTFTVGGITDPTAVPLLPNLQDSEGTGIKPGAVDKLPDLKQLSPSQTGIKTGVSRLSFNQKDKVVFTVPAQQTKLQFQHRVGNMWRMAAAPQLLDTRKVTGAQGVAFRKEHRFKRPGLYRYRIDNGPWEEFEVKGGISPKTDKTLLPAVKSGLSSSAQVQFGASKATFNLKDKAVFTVPGKDAKLQFQRREGNIWRMAMAPRLLGSRKVTGTQEVAFRREYRFKEAGKYRCRINNGPWETFEIKGALSPKTDKALLPAIKLDKGTSATGPMVKPKKLKPAKITSLRPGQTYTSGDKIKLRADYDRSHKVDFVLQEKRGGIYRPYKTVGNGNFDKLKPGTYRVGVVYHGDKGLPEKWIEFGVAKAKKLKVPPSATKKLDPGSSTKKKPTINLN